MVYVYLILLQYMLDMQTPDGSCIHTYYKWNGGAKTPIFEYIAYLLIRRDRDLYSRFVCVCVCLQILVGFWPIFQCN